MYTWFQPNSFPIIRLADHRVSLVNPENSTSLSLSQSQYSCSNKSEQGRDRRRSPVTHPLLLYLFLSWCSGSSEYFSCRARARNGLLQATCCAREQPREQHHRVWRTLSETRGWLASSPGVPPSCILTVLARGWKKPSSAPYILYMPALYDIFFTGRRWTRRASQQYLGKPSFFCRSRKIN